MSVCLTDICLSPQSSTERVPVGGGGCGDGLPGSGVLDRGLVPHLNLLDPEPHAQPLNARMWFASQLPSNSVGDIGNPSSLLVTESFPSWGFYKGTALFKKK